MYQSRKGDFLPCVCVVTKGCFQAYQEGWLRGLTLQLMEFFFFLLLLGALCFFTWWWIFSVLGCCSRFVRKARRPKDPLRFCGFRVLQKFRDVTEGKIKLEVSLTHSALFLAENWFINLSEIILGAYMLCISQYATHMNEKIFPLE